MARIAIGAYFFRYPLGGMLSNVLQYLVGFQRLGHEVWLVERANYENACFDPVRNAMTDDGGAGMASGSALLERFGLGGRWCFADRSGRYHGLDRAAIERVLRDADVFIDMGTHGAWGTETETTNLTVYMDGEPGFRQIHWEKRRRAGSQVPGYDRYVTNGLSVGTAGSSAPTNDLTWLHVPHPVVCDLFDVVDPPRGGAFTTVMNWQSHDRVELDGREYGQKDVEFARFVSLPARTSVPMEVAVSGTRVPRGELERAGWRQRDAHEVTADYDRFVEYLQCSMGEFSVCKNVFVALRTGWFSDKSAAFLACGRPVVVQDTGWSEHLPTGSGLFAVDDVEAAAAAIDEVDGNWGRHSKAAREIAVEHLDAAVVLPRLLDAL